jgi:prevent-host-death family protein
MPIKMAIVELDQPPSLEEPVMQKQFSIAKAKNELPSIIHSSVRLTRHGRPVAVLLSIREYEKLNREFKGNNIAPS